MKVKSVKDLPTHIASKVRYENPSDVYVFDNQVSGGAGYRFLGQDSGKYYYLWLRLL